MNIRHSLTLHEYKCICEHKQTSYSLLAQSFDYSYAANMSVLSSSSSNVDMARSKKHCQIGRMPLDVFSHVVEYMDTESKRALASVNTSWCEQVSSHAGMQHGRRNIKKKRTMIEFYSRRCAVSMLET